MQFRFPQFTSTPLAQVITNASPEAIILIQDLLLYDPQQRPTASACLQYPFFQVNNALPAPLSSAEPIASTFTRRPVQKTEAEINAEERALAKKVRANLSCLHASIFVMSLMFAVCRCRCSKKWKKTPHFMCRK